MNRRLIAIGAIAPVLLAATFIECRASDVLKVARSYKDGGGYEWKGSGVPEEIQFKGERILPKGAKTYCSGFTFAVVMKAANQRRLLHDKTVEQIRAFQKQWYGATKESAETQCAFALERFGIGAAVKPQRAKPGDFLQLWRTDQSGHSVVFLEWVKEDGRPIGVKYRSTQKSTDGIGDRIEYLADAPGKNGKVDPARMYFCRLKEP